MDNDNRETKKTTSQQHVYPRSEDFYRKDVPFPSQDELKDRFLESLQALDEKEEAEKNVKEDAPAGQPSIASASRQETEDEPEDDLDRELRRSGVIRRVLSVIAVLLLLAAIAGVLLVTVGKDTAPGSALRRFFSRYPFMRTPQTEADSAAGGDVVSDGFTTMGRAIAEKAVLGENIGTIREMPSLRFDVERDYGVKNVTQAITFDDDIWYINDGTEIVHYTSELVGLAIDYYSKLNARMNKDSSEVLKLITPKSRLLGNVTAIKADPIVIHTLEELDIGELRRAGDDFYLMVRLTEQTNDGSPKTVSTQVMRLETAEKEARVAEIAEVDS